MVASYFKLNIFVHSAPQNIYLITALNKKRIRLNDTLRQFNSSNLKGNVKEVKDLCIERSIICTYCIILI